MFSNFHLTAIREMTKLKTGHGCSTLYAFYIRRLGITGHTQSLNDSYYSKSLVLCVIWTWPKNNIITFPFMAEH